MLEADPEQRFSAEQCYNHKWIQNNTHTRPLNNAVMIKLEKFQVQNRLKIIMWEFISIYVYSNKEKEDMLKQFKSIDTNGDGTLTRNELILAYNQIYNDPIKSEEIVEQILNQIDID